MTSIIIPARNEKHLIRTIDNVFAMARNPVEVIVVLDGWYFEPDEKHSQAECDELKRIYETVLQDKRIRTINNNRPVGQRVAINTSFSIASGDWLMKIDGHSILSPGFDEVVESSDTNALNVPTVCRIDEGGWYCKYDAMYSHAIIQKPEGPDSLKSKRIKTVWKETEIEQATMSFLGMTFWCHKDLWPHIKHENHLGGWGYCGTELSLKAWLRGYSVKVTSRVLCGHLFRAKFPYYAGLFEMSKTHDWILENLVKDNDKFNWLVNKFQPEGY